MHAKVTHLRRSPGVLTGVLACSIALCLNPADTLARDAAGPPPSSPAPKAKRVGTGSPSTVPLTLADAVFLALRDNRTIRSAHIDRIAQRFDLRVAEDRFGPQFAVSGSVIRQRSAGLRTTGAEVAPSATIQLPTGATFGFAWANTLTEGGARRTRSSVTEISVNQPLLRGGGVEVNMAPVRAARLSERINQLRLKATVSETIAQVILAYRDLLRAQEEAALADGAVGRARDLLAVNRALIAAGRMAEVEVVQTEADLENQRIRVLEAVKGLDAARLLLLDLLALDLGTAIVAQESTNPAKVAPDLTQAMDMALAERPDYLGQRLVVEQNRLGVTVARNERLWDVSLFATGRLGRESVFGAGAESSRVSDMTAGLSLAIPLNGLRRDQPYVQASTALQTSELQLAAIRQGVEMQVRNSLTDIDIRWRQLESARRARDLTQRAVDIEKEKLKVGRSSNFQVRALENDLRSVESQQLSAMIGYLNALTILDMQLGTTLSTWQITLAD